MHINRTLGRFAGVWLAAVVGLVGLESSTWAASPEPAPAPAAPPIAPADEEPGSWHSQGLSLNAVDNREVDRFLEKARKAEGTISPQVRLAAERNGATVVGFDKRLKSPDSLKRKVATYMRGNEQFPPSDVNTALKGINDAVRYTLVWDEKDYTKGVRGASQDLAAWQNDSVRWANTWDDKDGYKAVNSAWRDARWAQKFEVQFHTPASFKANLDTHKLYEEIRLPGTPPERKAELRREQARIFSAVPVPEGATSLTAPAPALVPAS